MSGSRLSYIEWIICDLEEPTRGVQADSSIVLLVARSRLEQFKLAQMTGFFESHIAALGSFGGFWFFLIVVCIYIYGTVSQGEVIRK